MPVPIDCEITLTFKRARELPPPPIVLTIYYEPGYGWCCWPFVNEYFASPEDAFKRAAQWAKGTYA